MSWQAFAGALLFVCQVLFIVLAVLGALIVIIAVVVGAYRGFKALRK